MWCEEVTRGCWVSENEEVIRCHDSSNFVSVRLIPKLSKKGASRINESGGLDNKVGA